MSMLDWLFIGLLSSAILFLLFMVLTGLGAFLTGRNLKQLKKKRSRNKKKRKKLKRAIRQLQDKRKRQWGNVFLLLILAIGLGGGAFYARYYQGTTLNERDSDGIVQGYYLVEEISGQLDSIDSAESTTKVVSNIKELSGRLASYGSRRASARLTTENQSLLNKQYTYMKELGININGQADSFLDDEEKLTEFKEDLKRTQEHQQKVLNQFRIDENSLKKNG